MVGFPVIDVGDRTLRKHVQDFVHLIGPQRRADPIQKGVPRRSEKDMDKGQELLLAQGESYEGNERIYFAAWLAAFLLGTSATHPRAQDLVSLEPAINDT